MNPAALKQFLKETIELDENQWEVIRPFFKPLHVSRNERLLAQDQVAERLYFISTGCLRLYYTSENDDVLTRFMAFENTFITSMVSFISQQPAAENLQAVEKSELLYIRYADFLYLKTVIPLWEKFYIHLLEYGLIVMTSRLNSLLTQNASERYKTLLKNNPELTQRLSNSNLAAYLNISPETLSRLKSTI